MIRFSEDRSWDDLLPRLREALARGAFTDLAEAQRAFDLAPDEPLDCDPIGDPVGDVGLVSLTEMGDEIAAEAINPFASGGFTATSLNTPGVPFGISSFSVSSISGLPRSRALRTELLERRDALSAMPVAQLATCSAATVAGCQATATVWQAPVAGWAPAARISIQEDGGHNCERSLLRSSLRPVGRQRPWPRRAAPAVHDYALTEWLADRAVTCPADCLEYAVA